MRARPTGHGLAANRCARVAQSTPYSCSCFSVDIALVGYPCHALFVLVLESKLTHGTSLTTKKTKKWTRFWCDSPRVVDLVSLTPLPSHLQYITLFPIAHPCSATPPPGPRPRAPIGRCVSHHFSLRPFILEDFNGYPTENIKYVVVEIH